MMRVEMVSHPAEWINSSTAVGSENYIELVKERLGFVARKKKISNDGKTVVILGVCQTLINLLRKSGYWPNLRPVFVK